MRLLDNWLGIPVDGQHIAATALAPEGLGAPAPAVLFLHGWGGGQVQNVERAGAVARLGCITLTVDLRGHAGTAELLETVTREDNLRDALAAYDCLLARSRVDASRVAVVGYSYGGYLAAILASLRPVRFLALRAPAIYKDAGWEVPKKRLHLDPEFAGYRRSSIGAADNRALRACAAFGGDALVVESGHDEVIPHTVVANYVAALTNARSLTYKVLEGADHSLSHEGAGRAYTALLTDWLKQCF